MYSINCYTNRMQKEKHNGSTNKYTQKYPEFQVHARKKCEIIETKVQAYGETQVQKILKVDARPFKRLQGLCLKCKKKCSLNGIKQKQESHWRAPNLNGMPVYICYRPHRILCPEHGAINEYIPWADGTSRFTPEFNDEIAWMTCRMPKTDICLYHNINWRTVGNCFETAHRTQS